MIERQRLSLWGQTFLFENHPLNVGNLCAAHVLNLENKGFATDTDANVFLPHYFFFFPFRTRWCDKIKNAAQCASDVAQVRHLEHPSFQFAAFFSSDRLQRQDTGNGHEFCRAPRGSGRYQELSEKGETETETFMTGN